jgi:hypothetical protein
MYLRRKGNNLQHLVESRRDFGSSHKRNSCAEVNEEDASQATTNERMHVSERVSERERVMESVCEGTCGTHEGNQKRKQTDTILPAAASRPNRRPLFSNSDCMNGAPYFMSQH